MMGLLPLRVPGLAKAVISSLARLSVLVYFLLKVQVELLHALPEPFSAFIILQGIESLSAQPARKEKT